MACIDFVAGFVVKKKIFSVLLGLGAIAVIIGAYQEEPKLNQVKFDRCMEGRNISDREAIKTCERQQ